MKATPEQQEIIREAVAPLDTVVRRGYAKNVGHSDMRHRWDLMWLAIDKREMSYSDLEGLNDNHIDTVLMSIVKPL